MKAGRKLKFETPEELEAACDAYFEEEAHPTACGLALALGFSDRQSLYDYKKREAFSCTIKRAMLQVEDSYEKSLSGGSCTGAIFALKNMGWRDKQDINHSSEDGSMSPNRIEIVAPDE